MNSSFYNTILALAVLSSTALSQVSIARAELIYEDDLESSSGKMVESSSRDERKSSAKMPEEDREQERKDVSKSEMLRRQRVREELKNEDLLSQKLEELRLKDEVKRTEKLSRESLDVSGSENQSTIVQGAPVTEQKVGSVAETSRSAAPQLQTDAVNPLAGREMDLKASSELSVKDAAAKEEEYNQRVGISLRGGLGSISGSIYNVESKYAFGLGVAVDVTEYIGFVGGWTYSKYTLGASNGILSIPTAYPYQQYQRRLELSDNTFDVGIRASILKNSNKVRPFIGAGVAYRRGYINYDQQTRDSIRTYDPVGAQDVNISGFSGYIETGLDFKLTRNIGLYGMFRYYNTLSSNQNGPISPNAFVAPYSGNAGLGYNNDIRNQAGSELSKNNFYQLLGGLTVTF